LVLQGAPSGDMATLAGDSGDPLHEGAGSILKKRLKWRGQGHANTAAFGDENQDN